VGADVTVGGLDEVDVATSYDLEDVDGIGPTYADRLRSAGIETASALAVTDPARAAEVAATSEGVVHALIDRARTLVGTDDPVGLER
jgi:polyhydroxyalkanoate synthase